MDYRWFSLPVVFFAQVFAQKTPQKTSLLRCHTLTIIGVKYIFLISSLALVFWTIIYVVIAFLQHYCAGSIETGVSAAIGQPYHSSR